MLLETGNYEKRWCKVCEHWLPEDNEFFPQVKSKTNRRGYTYGHVCRRCKVKIDHAYNVKYVDNKLRKQAEERKKRKSYWDGREMEYMIAGIPVKEREEFLVKLYAVAGLDFYEEMEKARKRRDANEKRRKTRLENKMKKLKEESVKDKNGDTLKK